MLLFDLGIWRAFPITRGRFMQSPTTLWTTSLHIHLWAIGTGHVFKSRVKALVTLVCQRNHQGHVLKYVTWWCSAFTEKTLFENALTYPSRCSGSWEISKNKVYTVLWDTLYIFNHIQNCQVCGTKMLRFRTPFSRHDYKLFMPIIDLIKVNITH